MTKLILFTACLIVALTSVAQARIHAFYWDSSTGMVDLGTLGGDSYANGINDSGQIVGYSFLTERGPIHMVMWTTTGGIVDLRSLDHSDYSEARAINAAGDIVGAGHDANQKQVAFFWSSSTGYVSLGEVPANGYANGNDINDSDIIAGTVHGAPLGFVWRPFQPHPRNIGTLGGATSEALGINNRGHITGTAALPSGASNAFVWTRNGGMRDIGTAQEGSSTYGFAINDQDEVVGFTNNIEQPFYWSDATGIRLLRSLGGQSTEVYDINNSGAIVGSSLTPANLFHAALWSSYSATPQDLGTLPGGTTSIAKAINSSGQVVGWADLP
jgi:probable HAF family extracellular repeat protein